MIWQLLASILYLVILSSVILAVNSRSFYNIQIDIFLSCHRIVSLNLKIFNFEIHHPGRWHYFRSKHVNRPMISDVFFQAICFEESLKFTVPTNMPSPGYSQYLSCMLSKCSSAHTQCKMKATCMLSVLRSDVLQHRDQHQLLCSSSDVLVFLQPCAVLVQCLQQSVDHFIVVPEGRILLHCNLLLLDSLYFMFFCFPSCEKDWSRSENFISY